MIIRVLTEAEGSRVGPFLASGLVHRAGQAIEEARGVLVEALGTLAAAAGGLVEELAHGADD